MNLPLSLSIDNPLFFSNNSNNNNNDSFTDRVNQIIDKTNNNIFKKTLQLFHINLSNIFIIFEKLIGLVLLIILSLELSSFLLFLSESLFCLISEQ